MATHADEIAIINRLGTGVAHNPRARRVAFEGSANVVRFIFRTVDPRTGEVRNHTADVLMTLPPGTRFSEANVREYLGELLADHYHYFQNRFAELGSHFEHHDLEMDGDKPFMDVLSVKQLMTVEDVRQRLGFSVTDPRAAVGTLRLFGWFDEGPLRDRRSFRYLIEGMDLKTLDDLVHDDTVHRDCDRMCMYRMLRDSNPPTPGRPVRMFDPEEVNRWMNERGFGVGGLQDGLSSDHIQAHAQHFRYGHCAMDLTRSVVNLYIPEGGRRNSNLKTVCYMIVGDHCQRIVDASVLKSVMKSASERIGQRRLTPFTDVRTTPELDKERKRRSRSLDRVYRVQHPQGNDRVVQETIRGEDAPVDWEYEDREEDFEDSGSANEVRMGTARERRSRTFPLAREVDRFVTYTRESPEGQALIRERCKPTYWDGDDTKKWYYYVCTDDDDVEFLYEYLVRVLKIDPLRYARSFNGRCRSIEMQNTRWVANRDWETVRAVHGALYPDEPLQLCGLGTYGFRMLHRELYRLNPGKPLGLFECMSQYAPNVHRVMDNLQPTNRVKLLHRTFQPPYTNPRDRPDRTVDTLIPFEERRRVDVIRCYAACLRRMAESQDEYPIHDITNRLVPFDPAGGVPVGQYVVKIPELRVLSNQEAVEDWSKWTCFVPGERRVMSHRMVRRLVDWGLLDLARDVELVCRPDHIRQETYGRTLCQAFANVVKDIYEHPSLQEPDLAKAAKHMVNHLVGLCNGTTSAHSGMRYVFHDLLHMQQLLANIMSQDQIRRIQMKEVKGCDRLWNVSYSYYEMDSSGLQNKQFHLQPVYLMVLEEQAMLMFERLRTIPLRQLIQVHVDAIEYRTEPTRPWCTELEKATLSPTTLLALHPADYWKDALLGQWKWEEAKGSESAAAYYAEWSKIERTSRLFVTGRTVYPGQETVSYVPPVRDFEILTDPEDHVVVRDWQQALRTEELGDQVRDLDFLQRKVQDWYADGSADHADRSGLLVTGPAGTGKTFLLRMIYEYGTHLNLNILRSAFTHSACVQLGFDTQTLSSLFGIDRNNDTRAKLIFSRRFMAHLRSLNLDVLMVDEISMIPLNILECLMLFHRMNTNTRIVLGGDFHQLPPVDRQWNRSDDYNFFDETDVFPYLIFDAVSNRNGTWWRLSECMRTDDPLLKDICSQPGEVGTLVSADRFPMPSVGTPIWRFICWRNLTRKACNWYCMERYLLHHPLRTSAVCRLRDVYAQHEYRKQGTPPRFDVGYFEKQYDRMMQKKNRPLHYEYLQDFVYVEGMEVVCRNTLREWVTNGTETTPPTTPAQQAVANVRERGHSAVVNNRRARIVYIDHEKDTVTLRWMDLITRRQALALDPELVGDAPVVPSARTLDQLEPRTEDWNWADWDVILTRYDFVFNFVPGFCITTHMAQGETIREHYGLMEWEEIRKKPKMAYVAATRGSHSQLLHIIPTGWRTDPWGLLDYGTGVDLTTQVLCRLYHVNRFDRSARYPVQGLAPLIAHLSGDNDRIPYCERCNTSLLRPTLYRIGYHEPPAPATALSEEPEAIPAPAAPTVPWYPLRLTCEPCSK